MPKARRRRITRHQLKEDKFVSYAFRVTTVLKHHYREIAFAGVVMVVVLAVGTGYIRWSQARSREVESSMTAALALYSRGERAGARESFEQIARSFSSQRAGAAYFYLGNIALTDGRCSEARVYFQDFINEGTRDDILLPSAYSGIAQSYEEEGNLGEAAKAYEEAFRRFPGRAESARHLLDAARCYELLGDRASAAERYREAISGFPDTPTAQTAENRLKLLYPVT